MNVSRAMSPRIFVSDAQPEADHVRIGQHRGRGPSDRAGSRSARPRAIALRPFMTDPSTAERLALPVEFGLAVRDHDTRMALDDRGMVDSSRLVPIDVSSGSLPASHAAMPPAISLTCVNPRRCSKVAAIDER